MRTEHSFNSLNEIDFSSSDISKHEYLIVTADDFGYSMRRDEGIIQAFNNGIVTRASLLVNGQTARTTAVTLAEKHRLPLGIHLNLTEGKPLLENDSSSLKKEGTKNFRGKFRFREALSRGKIDMTHVKDEVEAQIMTFIKHVGYSPNHVDSHQHMHVCPEIRNVITQVMIAHSLDQVRIPLEPHLSTWFDGNTVFYNHVFEEAKTAMDFYGKYQIRSPHAFMGTSLMGKHMTAERIIETYKATRTTQQRPSVCEFMVHPGYACVGNQGGCGEGPDEFACSTEREHELKVLCDSELKRILKELGVVFIS